MSQGIPKEEAEQSLDDLQDDEDDYDEDDEDDDDYDDDDIIADKDDIPFNEKVPCPRDCICKRNINSYLVATCSRYVRLGGVSVYLKFNRFYGVFNGSLYALMVVLVIYEKDVAMLAHIITDFG